MLHLKFFHAALQSLKRFDAIKLFVSFFVFRKVLKNLHQIFIFIEILYYTELKEADHCNSKFIPYFPNKLL